MWAQALTRLGLALIGTSDRDREEEGGKEI